MSVSVRVLASVREVAPAAWDALVADDSPFLEWEWLAALEGGQSVGDRTGWLPQHLTLWEGDRLLGACPLYVKAHSHGEFVFDHAWASAAHRAGIDYYPKLLVGVPFTPVTGARFLAAPDELARVRDLLAGVLEELCTEQQFSSVHVNFCRPADVEALTARGWLHRVGYQYQWRNEGFRTFDDYLAGLRAKRRNQVRRERRALEEQGVEIRALVGADVPADAAPLAYKLYRATVDSNPWGQRYLTRRVFDLVFERWRDRLCLVLARRGGEVVAGTVNVQKGDALYGRYWGAFEDLRFLHFNVCYYAAIEHCVAAGLARFEPGAGGEFKHLRGFDATATHSVHWIRERRFRDAVRDYLKREREAVADQIEWYGEKTSRKRDDAPDGD